MKVLISFLSVLILSSTAFSSVPSLPEGDFAYSDTAALSTRHQRIIYTRTEAGKKLYNDYRELGYNCARKPNYFVKCRKAVATNPNEIEFKTETMQNLSPNFGTLMAVEMINESELVNTYQVTQEVSFGDSSSTDTYKVYHRNDSGKTYLDIQTETIRPMRFSFSEGVLTNLSFEKEKLSKNDVLIHALLSTYE